MTVQGLAQIGFYFSVLLVLALPLGSYMARVYQGQATWLGRLLGPIERLLYKLAGTGESDEMSWRRYAGATLLFNLAGVLAVYALLRLQDLLPFNPQGLSAATPDLAFNTAVSFATNTNWQAYSGEAAISYLAQMLGLAVQNFLSAATGMAVLVALIRGLSRKSSQTIGNFWVDMTRSTLYILLPLSVVLALVLVWQGVPQTFSQYRTVPLLQSVSYDKPQTDDQGNPLLDAEKKPVTKSVTITEQTLPLGPAASQIAIKQLGTNGGGFFGTNSAHPYENPTTLSNFLQVLSILLIAAALCHTFGHMVKDRRQGWAILVAMTVILVPLIVVCYWAEARGNPRQAALGADITASATNLGGNMEGKETRFGIANSVLWAGTTTAASNGSVNAMHDSFTPLGGLVPMWLIQLGEVVFGGVGCGLYGMIMFAIVAVFIAGLMVGRTPEYLGKKIEAYEMKMASLCILIPPAVVLVGTAVALATDAGTSTILNPGAHGLSEVLYAFSSAGNNNGSAFAGIGVNNLFYNTMLGFAMLVSRFWLIIPTLAVAGSLAAKKHVPAGPGTLPTHTPLFVTLLVGAVVVVGALTFIPALALGPIVEHLMLYQ